MEDDDQVEISGDLFQEPPGFLKEPPPPSFTQYKRKKTSKNSQGQEWSSEIVLRLLGKHPLWGHMLWNASTVMADYLDEKGEELRGKSVLELGAGAGLPSIIASMNNAKKVMATDYPDQDLLENLEYNVNHNVPQLFKSKSIEVKGHLWGKNTHLLMESEKFDIIILADLIFNHSQHTALLNTCQQCLKDDGLILVAFSHHRPKWAERDMNFFTEAAQDPFKFQVKKLFSLKLQPMFEEDFGPEDVRATVHFYQLSREIR